MGKSPITKGPEVSEQSSRLKVGEDGIPIAPVSPVKKTGRPRKTIDLAQVTALARLHCTNEEIADVLGIAPSTLQERLTRRPFRRALEKGRRQGAVSLRRLQWSAAQAGNVTMMIWLGKQILGQKDRIEEDVTHRTRGPLVIVLGDEEGDQDEDALERALEIEGTVVDGGVQDDQAVRLPVPSDQVPS